MSDYSNGGTPDSQAAEPNVQTVAYHRESAPDMPISIQRDQIREWANKNGLEVVCEFSDCGKSHMNVPAQLPTTSNSKEKRHGSHA